MSHIIRLIFLLILTLPYLKAQTDIHSRDFEKSIDELVKEYTDLDIFTGVILVADHGKPVYQKSYGWADREKKIKNSTHTLFDIGSMNKTFTSIVIKQLIHEGRLSYDDKLTEFISGFSDPKAAKITISHLLNHESGFDDYHNMEYFDNPETKKDLHSIIESIKKDPIFFEPGEDRQYSNSGYVLLGGVIEKASGDSYFDNVKNRIIIPLKLENTYVQNVEKYRSRRATGYSKTAFGELMTNEKFVDVPNPDGGFLSDAYDLLTFYRSYYYDDLLISKSIKKADPFFEFVVNLPPGKAPLMAGGFEGFNTAFFQVYQEDISIIVLCNMDEPAGENLASGILQVIQGKVPEKPSLPAVQNIAKAYQENGIAYVKNNFEKLSTNFHPDDPKDIILNMLGYAFMYQKEDIDSAIDIFTLNTKMFPFIANVWDSLGEAWANKGIKSKAMESYRLALKINPDLESAKNALQELEKSKSSH